MATTYSVVFDNTQDDHHCGLNMGEEFDHLPRGSVVRCDTCGRYWRKRMGWPNDDGFSQWRWETRWQRWLRERRQC